MRTFEEFMKDDPIKDIKPQAGHPLDGSIMVSHTWTVREQQEYERMKTDLTAARSAIREALSELPESAAAVPQWGHPDWAYAVRKARAALAAYEEVSRGK